MKKTVTLFLLSLTCCFSVVAQADLSKGLLAYYPFNGNAKDASGFGNDGIVSGATLTADQAGNPGKAYYFNGSSSYIVVADKPGLSPTGKFSICAKVNMQGFYNDFCYNNVILAKGLDRTYGSYSLRTTNVLGDCALEDTTKHEYRCDVQYIGATIADIDTKPYVTTNNWDCLIATYEHDTVKMYVNGVLRYHYYEPGKGTNTADLYIGMLSPKDRPFWFKGVIDEVRLYDRVLIPEEITMYCSAGQSSGVQEDRNTIAFSITPNPVADKLQLACTTGINTAVTVSLTDLLGRVHIMQQFGQSPFAAELDLSALASGVYLVTVQAGTFRSVQRLVHQ